MISTCARSEPMADARLWVAFDADTDSGRQQLAPRAARRSATRAVSRDC
jgi:hypothetical protein